MRQGRKHWLAVPLVVLGLGLGLMACSNDESASPSATSTEPVTLTFWQTMNEEETTTLQGLVDQYEADHPNVTVKMENVAFDQAQQKYDNAARAGKAPDILRSEIAWTPDFAAKGYLLDITDMVSAEDQADYLPAPFAYNVYNGRTWGLPQVTDAPALLYNVKMLQDAGVEAPTTMDELVAACEAVGNGKGIFLRGDSYFTQPWIWAYGGGLIDIEAKEIQIADSGSVAGMEAYASLFHNKCAMPDKDFANDYDNMQTAFKDGQVAMIVNGPWATSDVLSGKAFKDPANLGIAPVPAGPNGDQGSPVGGHNYVISANTENPEAAYAFIQWMNLPENQAQLALKNNLLPTRKSTYALPDVASNAIISAFGKQMEVATNRPVIPEGGSIYTEFTPNVQEILQGSQSASEGLMNVAKAWQQLPGPTDLASFSIAQ